MLAVFSPIFTDVLALMNPLIPMRVVAVIPISK
jgi:hypothetical protein